jgi:phosphatidylinositol 4-kinase
MWCSSSDTIDHGLPTPHHRIIRIPPGEAVVLNSAERAPYLVLIEILGEDLDFDPGKRANREILRKIVMKEAGQRGTLQNFGLASSVQKDATDPETSMRSAFSSIPQSSLFPEGFPSTASSSSTFSNDEEEMDLVEQLLGDNQPLRSRMLDIEDSIVLPPTPKNRELDMATWARSSPLLPPEDPRARQTLSILHFRSPSLSSTNSLSPFPPQISTMESDGFRILSLDEYSERMRTAAIMLAQLNADQGREPPTGKINSSVRLDNTLDRAGECRR